MYSCLAAIDSTISFIKNSKKIKINQTYLYASGGMIYKDQNSKILINEMLSYKEKILVDGSLDHHHLEILKITMIELNLQIG